MDYSNHRCGCMQRPHLPEPPQSNTGSFCGCTMPAHTNTQNGPSGRQPADPTCGCISKRSMQPNMQPQQMPPPNRNSASGTNHPCCSLQQPDMEKCPENAERDCLRDMSIAMAYVPMQRWNQVYDMNRGLTRGTIFPELDLPFVMGRCR